MHRRPTASDLEQAKDKLLPDVIEPRLKLLLVGINPGLYSAAIGCHFGRPGNRFWPTLYRAGLTPRLFSPHEQGELLKLGIGITNVVPRASARADELAPDELHGGGAALVAKIKKFKPRFVGILGVTAYRDAFQKPKAKLGPQLEPIGESRVWVLPNPSGLNAHYQAERLSELFAELRAAVAAGAKNE